MNHPDPQTCPLAALDARHDEVLAELEELEQRIAGVIRELQLPPKRTETGET